MMCTTHAYMDKEQARIELEGKLADTRNQRAMLIAQTKREAYDALSEGRKLAADSHQDAIQAASHSKQLILKAPLDGTVQELKIHTIGGVVPAAQPLMLIVPRDSPIEVEAFLKDKDIGFIEEGQQAQVKIDAYEYTNIVRHYSGACRARVPRCHRK